MSWNELLPTYQPSLTAASIISTSATLTTAIVAVGVGFISYQQWRVAKDKLRLDLYDKRFAIYLAAVDFYHSVMLGRCTVEQMKDEAKNFVKYRQAARFLFDPTDGIHDAFLKFDGECRKLMNVEDVKENDNLPGRLGAALAFAGDAALDVEATLADIQTKLSRYISFHRGKT